MDLELRGKVALVTGGSKGIGRAIAEGLAMEGASVAICARSERDLGIAASEISKKAGGRVTPIVADVGRTDQVNSLVQQTLTSMGRLDILVNNAGIPGGLARGPLETVTDEAVWQDLNTKYLGYLRCARACVPVMKRQGWGRIINIGGMAARQSGTYSTGAREVAVAHLTKTLSDELGQYGITVNLLHPGYTRHERWLTQIQERAAREGRTPDELEKEAAQVNAIRRIVDLQEVAHVVAFLASPKSGAITGEIISVSGGMSRATSV